MKPLNSILALLSQQQRPFPPRIKKLRTMRAAVLFTLAIVLMAGKTEADANVDKVV